MQTIKEERGTVGGEFRFQKDEDGDLSFNIKGALVSEHALIWLTQDAARRLYDAIGDEMGFASKPSTKKWELVTADEKGAGHTYRLKVEGGWLYRTVSTHPNYDGEDDLPVAVAQTFVPSAV